MNPDVRKSLVAQYMASQGGNLPSKGATGKSKAGKAVDPRVLAATRKRGQASPGQRSSVRGSFGAL